ncbi:phosphoinositide 3-kinase adapter protein 1-like [Glandiceps talaboti]
MDSSTGDSMDLSILFVDDGISWCEFLCGQFSQYDNVKLFWENITELPLKEQAAKTVNRSKAQMIIITPQYIDNCNALVEDLLTNVIVFLCGVENDSEETAVLERALLNFKSWYQISATEDLKDIISKTFRIIDGVNIDPDYVPIPSTGEIDFGKVGETDDDNDGGYIEIKQFEKEVEQDFVIQPDKYTMLIQPKKVICGSKEPLLIVFKAANLTDTTAYYRVKFTNKKTSIEKDMEGVRMNDYCLAVRTPPDYPPGKVTVSVFKQGVFSCLGECRFKFQDKLQHISEMLAKTTNPIELLSQALDISPMDVNKLDEVLTASYKRSMPLEGLDRLTAVRHEIEAVAKTKETPTLIHFAAKFGLQDLTSLLMNSPGALIAFEITNCNGDYPNDIAKENGHFGLADFLESFVECGALMEQMFGQRVVYDQIGYQDGGGVGIGGGGEDEGLYMVMNPTRQGYYNMGPQFAGTREGHYDVPFIPIPADPIMFMKPEKLKELITGDEENIENIYDTLPQPVKARSAGRYEGFQPNVDDDDIYTHVQIPFQPSCTTQREPSRKRREDDIPEEAKIVLGGCSDAQQKLIDIQKQVKEGTLTIDQAVHLFEAFKLNQKDKFLSFKNQTEFISVAKQSLMKQKEEFETKKQQAAEAPAAEADVEQMREEGKEEEKTSWQGLQRKMTCKPEMLKRRKGSRGSRPPSDECQSPFRRGDRLSTDSTSSSASSRHSRASIKSTDSGLFGSDDMKEEESTNQQSQVPRRQGRRPQPVEHRLSTNLEFSKQYLDRPVPPIPGRAADVIDDSDFPSLPLPPTPSTGRRDIVGPPPVPSHRRESLTPPPPPPVSYGVKDDVQGDTNPSTLPNVYSPAPTVIRQEEPPEPAPQLVKIPGMTPFNAAFKAQLDKATRQRQQPAQPQPVAKEPEPVAVPPESGEAYDDVLFPPKPPQPRPRPTPRPRPPRK